MAETYTGTDEGSGLLTVTEQDGTPYVPNVNKIKVSNTTLTDDGGGTVSVSTGGGGAGVTTIAFGSTGLTPSGATAGVVAVAGTLVVANGGTGATSLTDHGILLGSGTAAITATAVPANGQLLIGSTGVDPVLASLTSSASTIGIVGGAGTLDIDLNNTTVPAGSYGSATHVGAFTVDAQGRLTAAADVAIAGGGGGAPADAQYVVLTADPTLTDERILTPGDGIDITDGGAGLAVTVDADIKANSGIVIDTTELSLDLGASSITGTLALTDGGTGATNASAARTNLDIVSGQATNIITGGGGVLTSITVADTAVAASNTILFSMEVDDPQVISVRPPIIGSRNAGLSFTLLVDFLNTDPNPPGPGDHNVVTNYTIIG
jgi:hypothetical protein